MQNYSPSIRSILIKVLIFLPSHSPPPKNLWSFKNRSQTNSTSSTDHKAMKKSTPHPSNRLATTRAAGTRNSWCYCTYSSSWIPRSSWRGWRRMICGSSGTWWISSLRGQWSSVEAVWSKSRRPQSTSSALSSTSAKSTSTQPTHNQSSISWKEGKYPSLKRYRLLLNLKIGTGRPWSLFKRQAYEPIRKNGTPNSLNFFWTLRMMKSERQSDIVAN